jgi:hypothetical protein
LGQASRLPPASKRPLQCAPSARGTRDARPALILGSWDRCASNVEG